MQTCSTAGLSERGLRAHTRAHTPAMDVDALTAALEKEKTKSKSNLSKVVALSKEKKAVEAELAATKASLEATNAKLTEQAATFSAEQDAMLEAAAEAEEKAAALEAELEAAKAAGGGGTAGAADGAAEACLLYTSPSPRDRTRSRMPSSA